MSGILTPEGLRKQKADIAQSKTNARKAPGRLAKRILNFASHITVFFFFQGVYIQHGYEDMEGLLAIAGMGLSLARPFLGRGPRWIFSVPSTVLLVALFLMLVHNFVSLHFHINFDIYYLL